MLDHRLYGIGAVVGVAPRLKIPGRSRTSGEPTGNIGKFDSSNLAKLKTRV
jgi:hypothetical protein